MLQGKQAKDFIDKQIHNITIFAPGEAIPAFDGASVYIALIPRGANKWSEDELLIAHDAYINGKTSKEEVLELAEALGRTPGAITWKFSNLRRFDKEAAAKGKTGAMGGGSSDETPWIYSRNNPRYYARRVAQAKKAYSI